ncbi:MAG: hypothetical protein H0T90_03635 [Gemmatimonadales bacterium]|nr:hypothetical protein [Gemmatimonadales bacterium]
MVPFVLTVVLFAVGGQMIGPLAQRFREKSVWAEYVARAADFAGILSSDERDPEPSDQPPDESSDSTAARRPARRPGVNDPAALPKDLPVHSAPLEALYNIGPTQVVVFQRVAGSREAAIAELRERMRRQGWKVASETPGEWSTVVRWSKGSRSCMVEFADDSAGTEIWLRSSTAAATPKR